MSETKLEIASEKSAKIVDECGTVMMVTNALNVDFKRNSFIRK